MALGDWLGHVLGIPGGINNIGSGYAGLIGLGVVMLGWLVTARREASKYRIESAHDTVLMENKKLRNDLVLLRPYLRERKAFPPLDQLKATPELGEAIFRVMNNLELLALDIATGRASELYVKASQRSLICAICICGQSYIAAARSQGQTGAYKQLENLFIRFFMNRSPYMQWIIEYVYGKPIFRYSYLIFRMRYVFACTNWNLKEDFREEGRVVVGECMRKIRRLFDVTGYSAAGLGILYWWFY